MAFNIVFVVFPNLTQLDFTAPAQVFARLPDAKLHVAAKTADIIATDSGFGISPGTTFSDCPPAALLCVPGGPGVAQALQDQATIDFVARQGAGARYITSVCTGMFVLGVAGLLDGRQATTHWAYTDLIALCGATHRPERVVVDGNVITGGGVTSGIDFALRVVAEIAGQNLAESIQLSYEYDPQPPYQGGHPTTASEAAMASVADRYATANSNMRTALAAAGRA